MSGTEYISIAFAGEVDHGKSSIIGRLLADRGDISPTVMDKVKRICSSRGIEFEHAFILDAFEEEQSQGVTIDTCQIQFVSERRRYRIIDAPGHHEFLKNMVSGSVAADAAVLVIDAAEGEADQTRHHGYILKFLGIEQVVVAVNKMDLVGYSEEAYLKIKESSDAYLKGIGMRSVIHVPVCARDGSNLFTASDNLAWYKGPTLLAALDALSPKESLVGSLRFCVQGVYREEGRRLIAGRVESGRISSGDRIRIWPGGREATVKSILRWGGEEDVPAETGESVAINLAEQAYVERGNLIAHAGERPRLATEIEGTILWMGREPLSPSTQLTLKLLTQSVECRVIHFEHRIDTSSLEVLPAVSQSLAVNEIGVARLRLARPIAFDLYGDVTASGRFVLAHHGVVMGGGIATDAVDLMDVHAIPASKNISWEFPAITREQREAANGHMGAVVWLTGLPSSGKSTVARALESRLFAMGVRAYVIDGDNLRHGLNADLDFSADARRENIRRAGELAKIMADAGFVAITAFISPYAADRDRARSIMEPGRFIEVYLKCPLEICESRDQKGHYRKAREGAISDFTGVSAPYEEPGAPDITVSTDSMPPDECVDEVLNGLRDKRIIQHVVT